MTAALLIALVVINLQVFKSFILEELSGNMKPDKGKSAERIDGIVAALMALAG